MLIMLKICAVHRFFDKRLAGSKVLNDICGNKKAIVPQFKRQQKCKIQLTKE